MQEKLAADAITIQELDADLPIVDGTLTITTSTVGGLLQPFLNETYGGPLIFSGASKSVTADAVIIDGTAPLLNVANLPLHAVFTLQSDGTVVATLEWTLPRAWTFANSFPGLPPSALDDLSLTNSSYVLSTADGRGLSFTSTVSPGPVFGLFEALVGGHGPLTISGAIRVPQPTVTTPPLPPLTFPWDVQWLVPGIHLNVPLGVDLKLEALHLHDFKLHIYTPTDTTWLTANSTYRPLLAVTGTIEVPSAGIRGALTAVITSRNALVLDCDFSGATLGNLAKLSDLVNGPDLASVLPPEIASTLGDIALERAAIGLTGGLTAAQVSFVSVTVGLPGVTWTLLRDPVTIAVSNLHAVFTAVSPFGARALSVSLGGMIDLAGVTFDVVTQYPGFQTFLELDRDTVVPLHQIFSTLVPELPPPADLTIDSLDINVTPGSSYQFSATMADDPGWTIDVGPESMTVGSVAVDVENAQGAGATGSFSGTLEFGGGIELSMRYDVPGSFAIRADFPEVKLSQLIAQLDRIGVTLPTGFDIDLGQAFALIQEQDSTFTFSAAALVSDVGLVALTAEKTTAWGFAAGVQLGSDPLSSLPGFGALSAIESFVGLEGILVIVSSIDETGFQFPDMAQFQAPPLQGHNIHLPVQAGGGVVRGVNVYASLNAAKNAALKLLAGFLGVSLDGTVGVAIAVSAPNPATGSKLIFSVDTKINGGTTLTGTMGVLLQNAIANLFLTGSVATSIQGQPVTFTVTAAEFPTGVLVSGTMQGTVQFSPVTLNNVAIEIGIDDAEIPSVGFAATVDIENFESSIAVFFDSVDPSKSMFAGAVSDVTLLSIAKLIAGQDVPSPLSEALGQFGLKGIQAFTMPSSVGPSLDARDLSAIRAAFQTGGVTLPAGDGQIFFVVNTAGSVWHLTDLSQMLHYELNASGSGIDVALEPQFYCAPQATTIGTLQYPQGIHVIAEVDEFLIKTQIRVEISPSNGISADVDLDPITLFSSNVFSITGKGPNGGPQLSLATFGNPHFLLSGAMSILGVTAAAIDVSITAQGLSFQFNETEGPVQLGLNGSVDPSLALAAGGNATIAINEGFEASLGTVDLGHIDVDVSVSASLSISASPSGASATVQGSFTFEGLSLNIPSLTLDVTGPALHNLAETIWSEVQSAILGTLKDVNVYLNWLKNQILTGVATAATAVGAALSTVYQQSTQQIANAANQVLGYTVDEAAQALQAAGAAAQDAAGALLSAGYAAESVGKAIAKFFTGIHVDQSFGHIDTAPGPHVDTPAVPHIDLEGPHGDVSGFHTDVDPPILPHIDTTIPPHVDTHIPPHIDTPPALHVDTSIPPHIDTGTHIDT